MGDKYISHYVQGNQNRHEKRERDEESLIGHKFWSYLRKNDLAKGLFILALVLIISVTVWATIRVALDTEYPVLVVSSGSMCAQTHCVLPVGSLIVIKGENPENVQTGQIIVFRPMNNSPDFLVVHRVIATYTGTDGSCTGQMEFRTKGDANLVSDTWNDCPDGGVAASNLVGVYQDTIPIPYIGQGILYVRDLFYGSNGQFKITGIILVAGLVAALFAFEIWEPKKIDKK